ncbi:MULTISPECIES: crotonase/enoyl-CoA hydratase family protein [unclassified Leifsonia]|uniref:crotonase/enoyl-CoA hydratase family protein n=1 Tax=unclassified Leifsonia TaxID=2663824 RepID=UPI0008A7BA50|nr:MULTISPECIES: crotonase/enoyl-CoA hydratase family protein [unclassified Leifsonia]SEH72649.1 Enoyl-CoA hydratase/carnithine racemase [Leifsonia sp. CL154]SFL33965.1 Enoyl-CoA hydratase/carnithine racemase [Leifsonia sp. CL147]
MSEPKIITERRGHILLIGLNRPEKRNAADFDLLSRLADAYGELERDPELRVGLVYGVGEHFTAGLDLADLGPRIGPGGLSFVGPDGIDPWQVSGTPLTKPVVIAVQGTCLTLGVELILASDIAVAARGTRFGQIEVTRGILPFGGATLRFPRAVGWGNAMRHILTGDLFDAAEAHRIGLVQEVVDDGTQFDRALELAERVAAQAPLAVQAALANAKRAVRAGDAAAEAELQPALVRLAASEDARIGMEAFLTRTEAQFVGR